MIDILALHLGLWQHDWACDVYRFPTERRYWEMLEDRLMRPVWRALIRAGYWHVDEGCYCASGHWVWPK